MADILSLPTAAKEPVPRRRWRGPYPKGITSIAPQVCKTRVCAESSEHASEHSAQVREIGEWLAAQNQQVVGAVLVIRMRSGKTYDSIVGSFRGDYPSAIEALNDEAEALARSLK